MTNPILDNDWGHWFAGFVDGEGCFSVSAVHGNYVRTTFIIGLRADDRDILDEIKDQLGFGRVTERETLESRVAAFTVNAFAECLALADIFAQYPLRAKKSYDLVYWTQIVRKAYDTPGLRMEAVGDLVAQLKEAKQPYRALAI